MWRYDELQEDGELDWSPTVQSWVIGSFYWCYILSQVVGGVLTQHFGTKTVFGGSQLATAICSLLIPTASSIHYGFAIVLRSIQGIASVSFMSLTKFKLHTALFCQRNNKSVKQRIICFVYNCSGFNVASNVRHRWSLDTACWAISIYVFVSR